jgi:2-dehydropantoate 2-reductase
MEDLTVATPPWPRIAVLGAGAVGCYFGGMLARAGAPVTLIGRPPHVEAIGRDGLFMETLYFSAQVPISAAESVDAARLADVVLFCVKTLDTEDASRALAPHLDAGAIVVSLQNGVDNVERIRAAAGIDAIPAVVYVAAEMTAPGRVKHTGRGDLIIGDPAGGDARRGQLDKVAGLFARAGVPCAVSSNIAGELWAKLIMNCAYNAISALTRARYGRIVGNPGTRDLMRAATEEVMAVGRAAGVRFPDKDLVEAVMQLGAAMAGAQSSTAQDVGRGKRTEIDSLNGYVACRGAELGVPAPVNRTLHALVKLLEEANPGQAGAAGQAAT